MEAASIQSLPLPPPKFFPVSPRQENTASATRRRGWIGWKGKPCGAKCVTKFLLEETFIFSDAAAGIFEEEREDDTCINKCALAFPFLLSRFVRRSQFLSLFPCPSSVGSPSATGAALRSLFPVRSVRQGEGLQLPSERASWERLVESELWKCIIGGREGGKGGEGKHNKKALHIRGKCRKREDERAREEGSWNAAFIPKNGTRNVKCRAAAAARFLLSPP